MEVILLQNVARLGDEGKVINVKPGFARNYLIPTGLAAIATAQQKSVLQEAARQRKEKLNRLRGKAEAFKKRIEGRTIQLKLSFGEDEKSFGSITAQDILEALKQEKIELDRHAIQLEEPIKSLGTYEVPVRVHPEVSATVKVVVLKA